MAEDRKIVEDDKAFTFMRTTTTNKFIGIRNMFIIVDLLSSGIHSALTAPIAGKYNPQHSSNTLNAIKTAIPD